MTSRKDWMTTENRMVTLERQMTTRTDWTGALGVASRTAVLERGHPSPSYRLTDEKTPPESSERGEDDRLTWTDFMEFDTACPIDYE